MCLLFRSINGRFGKKTFSVAMVLLLFYKEQGYFGFGSKQWITEASNGCMTSRIYSAL